MRRIIPLGFGLIAAAPATARPAVHRGSRSSSRAAAKDGSSGRTEASISRARWRSPARRMAWPASSETAARDVNSACSNFIF
mgnify:CR=1 FL=1